MTPKGRAAMQQALEAFKEVNGLIDHYEYTSGLCYVATAALEEALAEQAEQEPVAIVEVNQMGIPEITWDKFDEYAAGRYELYAAPVRTKDLTDIDLWKLWEKSESNIDFARAVIAADREKNK